MPIASFAGPLFEKEFDGSCDIHDKRFVLGGIDADQYGTFKFLDLHRRL